MALGAWAQDCIKWRVKDPNARRIPWPFDYEHEVAIENIGIEEHLACSGEEGGDATVIAGLKMLLSCLEISGTPTLQEVFLECFRQDQFTKLFALPIFKASHQHKWPRANFVERGLVG